LAEPRPANARQSYVERKAIEFVRWLLARLPVSRRGRIAAIVAASILLTLPSLALLLALLIVGTGETERSLGALSYAGVFLANFLSTATVFIPVPGLLAIGQALIVSGAEVHEPWLIGLVGGIGMGLGETTAYVSGVVGSEAARQTKPRAPRWLQPALDRLIRWVSWLMANYGLPTLFVLSVIPDPIFEFAGLTAGATRLDFRKFLCVVVAGNCIRGLLLAYLGNELLFG
jgi:membrane protein DedA with SNARE-associated domain